MYRVIETKIYILWWALEAKSAAYVATAIGIIHTQGSIALII